jgi:hypothetical protein
MHLAMMARAHADVAVGLLARRAVASGVVSGLKTRLAAAEERARAQAAECLPFSR